MADRDDRWADRPGDERLAVDPAALPPDAGVVFIGRIETPWKALGDCPKNLREARERGQPARLQLKPEFGQGLAGLAAGQHVIVLYWLDAARRDLIRQQPRHLDAPKGTFALRSPVRPNPIGLAIVRITDVDTDRGILDIDAIDCRDGTPLLDIKPYFTSTDQAVV